VSGWPIAPTVHGVHFARERFDSDARMAHNALCFTHLPLVCTENHIRVYQVTESAKLAQW